MPDEEDYVGASFEERDIKAGVLRTLVNQIFWVVGPFHSL